MDTATSTILLTSATGIFLAFFAVPFLFALCFLLYALWPTDHSDF